MIGDARSAACVAIGDELVRGDHADTNSGEIARALAQLGIEVRRCVVLGDDRDALERAFYELTREFQIVVATGGIGPTLDDVTREAAAAAAGVGMVRDEASLQALRESYARRARPMPESNERQAWFPVGAQIMRNAIGTAPGFRVWIDGGMLAVLPGPPHEMRAMLADELIPWLEKTCGVGAGLAQHNFYLLGLAESAFGDRAGAWMARGVEPLMGVTAHNGVLRVTLRARARGEQGARELVAQRAAEFRQRFAAEIFSEDDPRPGVVLGRALIERGVTFATAESCTGGLLAELLTEAPGISAAFKAGWVTYSNDAKVAALGVERALIERHGAVSSEVAAAMALGARARASTDFALAITGIAGPDGGTPEKPVGLVWFALASASGVHCSEQRFPPVDRASIRRFAAHAALDLVRRRALARA
jgi:nicotinamide-nucleotide amidase